MKPLFDVLDPKASLQLERCGRLQGHSSHSVLQKRGSCVSILARPGIGPRRRVAIAWARSLDSGFALTQAWSISIFGCACCGKCSRGEPCESDSGGRSGRPSGGVPDECFAYYESPIRAATAHRAEGEEVAVRTASVVGAEETRIERYRSARTLGFPWVVERTRIAIRETTTKNAVAIRHPTAAYQSRVQYPERCPARQEPAVKRSPIVVVRVTNVIRRATAANRSEHLSMRTRPDLRLVSRVRLAGEADLGGTRRVAGAVVTGHKARAMFWRETCAWGAIAPGPVSRVSLNCAAAAPSNSRWRRKINTGERYGAIG